MNDFIMCEKHHYQRKLINSRMVLGREMKSYEDCPYCLKEQQTLKEREELKKLYDKLDKSNVGRRYYHLTFKNLQVPSKSFEIAKNRAEKYCENFNECSKRGLGIYFFGNNGRGKTALIACMFKELIKQGYNPYITTIDELQDDIINKRATIEDIKRKEILCLDDIGSENYVKNDNVNYKNDLLFQIVSHRDKNLLPTLFTSNHKIAGDDKEKGLLENGIMKKTVERISTLATVKIEIQTNCSFRANKEKNIPF